MRRATGLLVVCALPVLAQEPAVPAPAVSPAAVPAPISPTDPPVAPAVDAVPVAVPSTASVVPAALVTDTLRSAASGLLPDAPEKVTRPLALRIVGIIAILTLSTLLLYNVRSR